jgi:hypothetical protein
MFKISTVALALAVAALAFWATMFTNPPQTEASVENGTKFTTGDIAVPGNLPEAEAVEPY